MTEPPTPAGFFGHGSPMNAIERNRYTDAWRDFGACVERPRRLPRSRRPRGRRDRETPLGRPRSRQLGSRSRHMVGARSHVPYRGRARRAAVDQRVAAVAARGLDHEGGVLIVGSGNVVHNLIPLLHVAALAAASNETPDVLVSGYAHGSLSMTCHTLGATCAEQAGDDTAGPPPGAAPPVQANI